MQEVSGGTVHVLFRLRNGTVEACGSNLDSMSGQPEGVHEVTTPTPIAGLEDIVEISGGYGNGAITATGEPLTWGLDEHGQACTGSETKAVYPPQVVELGVEQFYSAGDNYETRCR